MSAAERQAADQLVGAPGERVIAQRVALGGANRDMAVRVLRQLGRAEGSALVYTAHMLTATEAAAALTARGWTWADVIRRES